MHPGHETIERSWIQHYWKLAIKHVGCQKLPRSQQTVHDELGQENRSMRAMLLSLEISDPLDGFNTDEGDDDDTSPAPAARPSDNGSNGSGSDIQNPDETDGDDDAAPKCDGPPPISSEAKDVASKGCSAESPCDGEPDC